MQRRFEGLVRMLALTGFLGNAMGAAEPVPPAVAYLGQKLPGHTPERFAPALLADFPFLGRIAFAPDGRECFFTVGDAFYTSQRMFVTRFVAGTWTPPVPAAFTAGFEAAGEPWFTPDGKRLYFNARLKDSPSRVDIYQVDRIAQGWSSPVRLPAPVNSDANDFCFSQVADGTRFLLSKRSGAPQVHWIRPQATEAELVPAPVLSVGTFEGDPCVPQDGRFLVFYSGRQGGFGRVDLQVTFPDGKGGWLPPRNLGAGFNTAGEEYGATLTTDGNYLFFVRKTMERGDLYWVSTRAIDALRP